MVVHSKYIVVDHQASLNLVLLDLKGYNVSEPLHTVEYKDNTLRCIFKIILQQV